MLDIFYKDKSQYTNQLNPVKAYIEQLTMYIATTKNLPKEQAQSKAIALLKTHFKDKPVKYFEREDNGDRVVKDSTLLTYIRENVKAGNILVPTFTSYLPPHRKKSILAEFTVVNVKGRAEAKKIAQKAKAEGDLVLATSKNNEQNNRKIYNNSLSGVFSQLACILYNPTAHSTLTSMTRTMTSLSNASNEQLIAGNRYLPRPIDVFNLVVYNSTYVDVDKMRSVVEKFQLHLPTVQETVKMLQYSSDLYFHDQRYYDSKIIPYLDKLTPYHLAGICYFGDLYHLRQLNPGFIRQLLTELVTPVDTAGQIMDDVSPIYKVDEAILYMVHGLFFSKIKGFGKDYEKMNQAGIASSLYQTCQKVVQTLRHYQDFFNMFFMNEVFPTNSHRLGNMRRRVVVLSDTDSTCFTLDEWVDWYHGGYKVDDTSIGLASCITYFASQNIVNSLAIVSKNMNVAQENLNTLGMKNEYLWNAFVPTEASKHYYASTVMQEGNVFTTTEPEIKGVHLKNSAVPKGIVDHGKALMEYVLTQTENNQKVKFNYILTEVTNLEKHIIDSVTKGESQYLKRSKIKAREAYSQDEFRSPFQRHTFWQEVFGPRYGMIEDPPYDVIKIPTTVTSGTSLRAWLDSITDTDLRERLVAWMQKYAKKDLPTIYLNLTYVAGYGIPPEIISVIDLKRIVFDSTMQHRLLIDTLGVLLHPDKLVYEQFNL